MKRTLLAICTSALFAATPAFAIVGGPFDNNLFFGNDISGTYQAVLSGKNISGIMLFGTTANSGLQVGTDSQIGTYGNAGRGVIFVEGYMVVSNVTAVANVADRQISVAIDGSRELGDVTITYRTDEYSSTDPTVKIGTAYWRFELDGAVTVAGLLNAKFSKTFPSLEFRGKGDLSVEIGDESSIAQDDMGRYVYTGPRQYSVHWNGIRTGTSSPFIIGTLPQYTVGYSNELEVFVPEP